MRVTTLLAGALALIPLTSAAAIVKPETAGTTAPIVPRALDAGDPAGIPNDATWLKNRTGYRPQTQWWRLDPNKDFGCELTAQYLNNSDTAWQTRYQVVVFANPGTVADELFPNDKDIVARTKAVQKDMLETWAEAFFVSVGNQRWFNWKTRPQARVSYNYKSKAWEAESVENQIWRFGHDQYVANQVRAVKDWEEKTLHRCRIFKDF